MPRGLRHVLCMLCVGLQSLALAQPLASSTLQPVIEKARAGTQCIADPATMRRDHAAMLKHQRDATVHGGIRGAKASLKGCIECHASPVTNSVAQTESNFCVACHSYTAVRIDCFECHATRPHATLPPTPRPPSPVKQQP